MNLVWYALWFVVAVSLLVTVHEFGHFWVARRLGFKVLRFSVGFGKPLVRRVAGADRVEYVIAAIPLGGYVKLLDEREGPVAPEDLARSFTRRPPWQRIVVLLAGPAFNILFAVLVLWGMFWASGVTEVKPVVGDLAQGSIAARAGLRSGDEIRAINGAAVTGQRDVVFGLLDAMSSRGEAALAVRGADGAARTVTLSVPDAAQRRRLTEPSELFRGLGFQFWAPPIPAVLGQVVPDGPAARAGLRAADQIVAIEGVPVHDFRDIVARISAHPGETLAITYRRGGVEHRRAPPEGGAPRTGERLARPRGEHLRDLRRLEHRGQDDSAADPDGRDRQPRAARLVRRGPGADKSRALWRDRPPGSRRGCLGGSHRRPGKSGHRHRQRRRGPPPRLRDGLLRAS